MDYLSLVKSGENQSINMVIYTRYRIMKHYQQLIVSSLAIVLSFWGTISKCQAQSALWSNYEVVDTNEAYTPLRGGIVLPGVIPGGNQNIPINFVNFTGAVDMNDGTADSIPIGLWAFEYNGMLCNSVNINIDGWVSFNPIGGTDPIPLIS